MKFTTAFFVAILAIAVSGAPQPNTNAERLARGLTPKSPLNLALRDGGGTPVNCM
jgi:hypothetical protein